MDSRIKVSFSDSLAVVGLVFAIVLVVLDKGGKLKPGPMLFLLLALACIMTMPLALGNPWVANAGHGMARVARSLLAIFVCVVIFSLIAVWITAPEKQQASTVPDGGALVTDQRTQLSLTCDTVPLPVSYHAEIWSLDTIFLKGLLRLSANPLNPVGFWPSDDASGGFGYRCVVKNFSSTALFGISMSFDATVMGAVEEKDGTRHGGAIIKRSTLVVVIPLPLGPQEAFTFYVCNYGSDKFIDIDLPTSATVDSDGAAKKATGLKLSSTVGNRLELVPFRHSSQ